MFDNPLPDQFVANSIAPSAEYAFGEPPLEHVMPTFGDVCDPQEDTQECRFSEAGTPLLLYYDTPISLTYPSTYETPISFGDTSEPFGMTPAKTDVAGPSNYIFSPPPDDDGALGGPSKPRKGSPDAIIPPARRVRRVSQRAELDPELGFVDTNLSLEVQKTMREVVQNIRLSEFFKTHAPEPKINTDDGRALMQVARPELLVDYRKRKGSIYSLFIKVDEQECKCLWCGDVQLGKPQRAIGHFRMKHLDHKPFICNLDHGNGEVW